MPSLLPGFEYDIFISYRQKDNRGDRWVTEFVNALKAELDATFKDDVSIYFDENPHDGLRETHDVDESLAQKLRCAICIPVLSQTYCDPKSFAWRAEFLTFCKLAREDSFGLKVKLANGNVASRVLPVRIHDLEAEDKALVENAIGGAVRPVDFIFKAPGVARPLRANEEHPQDNLEKTYHRDQINKVALAIKEIITAMKSPAAPVAQTVTGATVAAAASGRRLPWKRYAAALFGLLAILAIFIFVKLRKSGSDRISIAILPFRNQTANKELDGYSFGVASEIRTQLSLSKQFDYISSDQATIRYKDSQQSPSEIGEELGVDAILLGSLYQMGDQIKVMVELADGHNGKSIWSLPPYITKVNSMEELFKLQSSIAHGVLDKFSMNQNYTRTIPTTSMAAYHYFLQGRQAEAQFNKKLAEELFSKAIQLDSNFLSAYVGFMYARASTLWNSGADTLTREKELKPYVDYLDKRFPDSWEMSLVKGEYYYHGMKDYTKGLEYLQRAAEINPNSDLAVSLVAAINRRQLNYRKSFEYRQRTIELDPSNGSYWHEMGLLVAQSGNITAQIDLIKIAHAAGLNDTLVTSQLVRAGIFANKLDEFDEPVRQYLGKVYDLGVYESRRDWKSVLNTVRQMPPNKLMPNLIVTEKAFAHHELGNEDSARYYANLRTSANELDLPELMALTVVQGHRDPPYLARRAAQLWPDHHGQDLSIAVSRDAHLVIALAYSGNYKEATDLLRKITKTYPEFGGYHIFNTFLCDKIRKEYPEFETVLKGVTLPTPLDPSEVIRKYAKKSW